MSTRSKSTSQCTQYLHLISTWECPCLPSRSTLQTMSANSKFKISNQVKTWFSVVYSTLSSINRSSRHTYHLSSTRIAMSLLAKTLFMVRILETKVCPLVLIHSNRRHHPNLVIHRRCCGCGLCSGAWLSRGSSVVSSLFSGAKDKRPQVLRQEATAN